MIELNDLDAGSVLEADLVIIGGGPVGLTIAREFFDQNIRVLVVESGRQTEDPRNSALNTVESVGEPSTPSQIERRRAKHSMTAEFWSHDQQPYGVRCRLLGGSSQAWAGKSAAFDPIDFEARSWVPHSGWPFMISELEPHIDRAAKHLNLGPNTYDDELWSLAGRKPDEPRFDPELLKSMFWQFARSRINPTEFMRFGPEFARAAAPNVRVLLNATATKILTNTSATNVEGVEVACLEGVRARVNGKVVVLAASAIENPRLLLASNQVVTAGLGNANDVVGRYLLDHQSTTVAKFNTQDAPMVYTRFGYLGVPHGGRMHLYSQGLALPRSVMEKEGLLNCALYMIEERAPDHPLDALKRLMRRQSPTPLADLLAVAKSPGFVAKTIGIKAMQNRMMPQWLEAAVVNAAIKINPNFTVAAHLYRGTPHKLLGLTAEGISEQRPDPESRITLSQTPDPLGVRRPKVNWKLDRHARKSMARLGELMSAEFIRKGLPAPTLEAWIAKDELDDPNSVDMAHTMGTTRMSDDPKQGVVDRTCNVHGVTGLYVAGGSVFPTCGHTNPTLMYLAVAVRLADHLKLALRQRLTSEIESVGRPKSAASKAVD